MARRYNSQGQDDRGKRLGFSDTRSSEEKYCLAGVDASGAGRRGLRSWSPDPMKGSIWLELDPQGGAKRVVLVVGTATAVREQVLHGVAIDLNSKQIACSSFLLLPSSLPLVPPSTPKLVKPNRCSEWIQKRNIICRIPNPTPQSRV